MKRIAATSKNIKKWEDIPLVKLSELLKQMIWFDGKYFFHDSYDHPMSKKEKKKEILDKKEIPHKIQIFFQYRENEIIIICNWNRNPPYGSEHNYKEYPYRFEIGVEEPYDYTLQIQRYSVDNQIIFAYTKFYSAAIDKIENALYNAQEVIDNKIAEKEEEERIENKIKLIAKRLCKKLGVHIVKQWSDSLIYREDYEHSMTFNPSFDDDNIEKIKPSEVLYSIKKITGTYTEKEIKKIIQIIGGNPRAVAERLTKQRG
jgi:hypothetical protein